MHYRSHLRGDRLGKPLGDVSHFVDPTALHSCLFTEELLDRRAQRFRAVDDEQLHPIRTDRARDQAREQILATGAFSLDPCASPTDTSRV